MHTLELVDFGTTAMFRMVCPQCRLFAFVINGTMQCCGCRVEKMPETFARKRGSETQQKRSAISLGTKTAILSAQNYLCFYCATDLHYASIEFDHLVPWSYGGNSKMRNLVASCHVCNAIKGSKVFSTTQEARRHIRKERERQHGKNQVHQNGPTDGIVQILRQNVCEKNMEPGVLLTRTQERLFQRRNIARPERILRSETRQPNITQRWRQPRVCEKCNTTYEPVREKQRFCSKQCHLDFHNDRMRGSTGFRVKDKVQAKCLWCGAPFTKVRGNQRFDSDSCRMNWHNQEVVKAVQAYEKAKEAGKI